MKKSIILVLTLATIAVMLLSACGPAPTPQVVEKIVEKVVQQTVVVEKEKPVEKVVEKVVEKTVVVEKEAPKAFDAGAVLKGKKLAVILSGPVNDAGWNTQAYKAVVNARDKFGMQIAYTESTKVEDAEQVIRDYAEAGFDMIMAHGYEYADQIAKVAKEYPKKTFIHSNGAEATIPNLYTVTFSAGEGGYFMGQVACRYTKTNKVTYIVGTKFPIMDYHVDMSKQACKDLNSKAEILYNAVGSWGDQVKTKELAKAAIEQGSDVLILVADAGDKGGIEAGLEALKAGNKNLRIISWVADKNYLGPELVIGGWTEDVTKELEYILADQIAKGNPGGHFAVGLVEGATYMNPFYGIVPQDVEKAVVDMYEKYKKDAASIPTLKVRRDL